MSETNFSRKLKAKLTQAVDTLAESLASGQVADYNHYSKVVGTIEGLRGAIDLCNELDREYE